MKKTPVVLFLVLFFFSVSHAISQKSFDLKKAEGFIGMKEYGQAIELLTPLAEDREYILADYARFRLAEAFAAMGDGARSWKEYQRLISEHPGSLLSGKASCRLGDELFEKGDWTGASGCYSKVVEMKAMNVPKDRARDRLGICWERLGSPAKAAASYYEVTLHHPLSPYTAHARSRLESLQAIMPVPAADALFTKGKILYESGEYSRAAEAFFSFCSLYPGDSRKAEALLKEGISCYRTSGFKRAEEALLQARKASALAGYYLVLVSIKSGRKADALSYFRELAASYPGNEWAAQAEYSLAKSYGAAGDLKSSRLLISDLMERFPYSDAAAHSIWDRGYSLYKSGAVSAAYEIFKRVTGTKAEARIASKCYFWYAKCCEKLGKAEEGKKALEQSARQYPYTYYGMRASEKLGMKPSEIPLSYTEARESELDRYDTERAEKCRELMAHALLDEALVEARELVLNGSSAAAREKGKAYTALIMSGKSKFRTAIRMAEEDFDRDPRTARDPEAHATAMSVMYPQGFDDAVKDFCGKYGVDPMMAFALIREESRFNPRAVSRASARGLTQIMPRTGKSIAKSLRLYPYSTSKLFDPDLNVKMGVYYLKCMMDIFDGNKFLALASYNGGAGRVGRWVKRNGYSDTDEFVESIPIRETRLYVQKVLESYWNYKRLYGGS